MFGSIFKNKRILITGHTGFKGSWLTLWLLSLGAKITGISLPPNTQPSHFEILDIEKKINHNNLDICDYSKVNHIINLEKPDFIFHLAAQSLVSKAYKEPLETIKTNILGTANVLQSLRNVSKKTIAIIITSDKCYKNLEWEWGYRENDILGGNEAYSSSKASAEIIIESFFKSYFLNNNQVKIGVGRAGNVIGGGDWAKDRIVPDAIRAWNLKKLLKVRNPNSTRPWQFVLEPLSGYLSLAYNLYLKDINNGEAFNFGPNLYDKPVSELITQISKTLKIKHKLSNKKNQKIKESGLLKLNCDKAQSFLNWNPVLNFEETVDLTANWYKKFYNNKCISLSQIKLYEKKAKQRKINWTITN